MGMTFPLLCAHRSNSPQIFAILDESLWSTYPLMRVSLLLSGIRVGRVKILLLPMKVVLLYFVASYNPRRRHREVSGRDFC